MSVYKCYLKKDSSMLKILFAILQNIYKNAFKNINYSILKIIY